MLKEDRPRCQCAARDPCSFCRSCSRLSSLLTPNLTRRNISSLPWLVLLLLFNNVFSLVRPDHLDMGVSRTLPPSLPPLLASAPSAVCHVASSANPDYFVFRTYHSPLPYRHNFSLHYCSPPESRPQGSPTILVFSVIVLAHSSMPLY
ncbi:hypothetical protein DL93DRAFT_1026600 [Clavulina sp. PMI_390]|nr:hypothetical protein DL93DRAFT_1026600 [Clavulina sp. PMI_390]